MTHGASSDGNSALPEEDSTGVRRLLKLLKVSTYLPACAALPSLSM